MFPETGPLRRELYSRHLDFFRHGADTKERLFLAGNRVGKTEAGAYECTLHLTGLYPGWWEGRRFEKPIKMLAAGDTTATTRDIIQEKFLGPFDDIGTGMIPGDLIVSKTRKRGVADAVEEVKVRHKNGWINRLWLRSYEQGRKVFQGFEQDFIWLDEEVSKSVYDEAIIRTMTTRGSMAMTYTPINGMTELTMSFIEGKVSHG